MIDQTQRRQLRLTDKQEALLDSLTRAYLADAFHLTPGYAIRPLLGANRLQVLRVKLRRVGWDIVAQGGKNGGYRLARLIASEGS
jgi:hypothetical protein